jgi:hypothetical protein
MLTRRQIVELGAAACVAAMLGHVRSAVAAETDPALGGYLRRETWLPLVGEGVEVAGVTLLLGEVADLPLLAGRDDAFRLELTGPAGMTGGIHPFQHPALGSVELFLSPVDTVVAGVQRYEVVVNRSVGVPRAIPTAPSVVPASRESTAPPAQTGPRHRGRNRRHPAPGHARHLRQLGALRRRETRGQAKIAS